MLWWRNGSSGNSALAWNCCNWSHYLIGEGVLWTLLTTKNRAKNNLSLRGGKARLTLSRSFPQSDYEMSWNIIPVCNGFSSFQTLFIGINSTVLAKVAAEVWVGGDTSKNKSDRHTQTAFQQTPSLVSRMWDGTTEANCVIITQTVILNTVVHTQFLHVLMI